MQHAALLPLLLDGRFRVCGRQGAGGPVGVKQDMPCGRPAWLTSPHALPVTACAAAAVGAAAVTAAVRSRNLTEAHTQVKVSGEQSALLHSARSLATCLKPPTQHTVLATPTCNRLTSCGIPYMTDSRELHCSTYGLARLLFLAVPPLTRHLSSCIRIQVRSSSQPTCHPCKFFPAHTARQPHHTDPSLQQYCCSCWE
jgi:hypothetical protein